MVKPGKVHNKGESYVCIPFEKIYNPMKLLKNEIFFNGEITKNWGIMMPDIWGDIQHNIMQKQFFLQKKI